MLKLFALANQPGHQTRQQQERLLPVHYRPSHALEQEKIAFTLNQSYLVATEEERHTMFHDLQEHGNLADDRPLHFENPPALPPRSPRESEPGSLRTLISKWIESHHPLESILAEELHVPSGSASSTLNFLKARDQSSNPEAYFSAGIIYMELKDLSSNWKMLKASIQPDSPRPPKRKAKGDHSFVRSQQNSIKRQRQTSDTGPHIQKPKPAASFTFEAKDKINEGLSQTAKVGKYLAIDCEMVGVGPYNESALARVSVINYHGHQVYDSFVLPKEEVKDYRTFVSGITPQLLLTARPLETVQQDIAKLLDGKILIGHAVENDLNALFLGHPRRDLRDTSEYPGFRRYAGGTTPALKKLAREVLGINIQVGAHSSIEDARATMLLFCREKSGFEMEHRKKWGSD
ncbi:MAG: hypothetical protein Q9167_000547 [Letrouitia subvulpina]